MFFCNVLVQPQPRSAVCSKLRGQKKNVDEIFDPFFFKSFHFHAVVESSEITGSALAGRDFIPGLVEVNFASGEDSATVTLPLTNDAVPEESKRFSLRLLMPDNGRLNEPNNAVVIILDYDSKFKVNSSH